MKDWRALLAAPRFRALWLALLCDNLGSWCVIAALPILVAQRFGAGLVLVLSLGLRLLPKLLLAPLAGLVLHRFGPHRTAGTAMLMTALLTALLPWCTDIVLLQILLAAIGTLDLFILPALFSLRGPVTPPGLEMACNTLFSVADRAAKIAGPALGGLALAAGLQPAFVGYGLLIALATLPLIGLSGSVDASLAGPGDGTGEGLEDGRETGWRVGWGIGWIAARVAGRAAPGVHGAAAPGVHGAAAPGVHGAAALGVHGAAAPGPSGWRLDSGLADFWRILRTDRQIVGLLVAAITYSVMLGGLRPFLFWANRDWFGASDTAWTGLLAAQGAGALIGAVASAVFVPRLLRHMSAYTLTLLTGVLEGAIHLLLLLAHSSLQAVVILALAGIPEIISTAAWFTVIQARMSAERQGRFFTLIAPLWDLAFAVGLASAGLHAQGVLSLSAYWALVSLIATVPLVPLILLNVREGRMGR